MSVKRERCWACSIILDQNNSLETNKVMHREKKLCAYCARTWKKLDARLMKALGRESTWEEFLHPGNLTEYFGIEKDRIQPEDTLHEIMVAFHGNHFGR